MDEYRNLIELIRCSLYDQTPNEEQIKQLSFEKLLQAAQFHSLTAICYAALERSPLIKDATYLSTLSVTEQQALHQFKEEKEKAVRKNILMNVERERICKWLDGEGIWYMPLKGVLLQDMYPKTWMRQMSDNDILFDATYKQQVRDFFVANGYEVEGYDTANHDAYQKEPIFHFEMHRALFNVMHDQQIYQYYKDVEERLQPRTEGSMERRFIEEDCYVYIVSHAAKHASNSGTGIRTLVDFALYQEHLSEHFDWDYVKTELAKMNLVEFEDELRSVSVALFGRQPFDASLLETNSLVNQILHAGTYGTLAQGIENRFKEMEAKGVRKSHVRFHYYMERLFPPYEFYVISYPIVEKKRYLIPFFWIARCFRGLFKSRRKVLMEIRYAKQSSQKDDK